MKVTCRLFFVVAVLATPMLIGCGPSRMSEESTREQIAAEEEAEAQEADVVADSEQGDESDESQE